MTSRAADYPARHLRLAAEGPGPAERLLDALGRWASTAPDPAAATAAGLPALLPGLAGEPVQMLQGDAGTARPSLRSASRPPGQTRHTTASISSALAFSRRRPNTARTS